MRKKLNDFITDYYQYMLRYACKYTRNVKDAEDLVQQACLKITEAEYTTITISLFTTAIHNLWVNKCRRIARVKMESIDTYFKGIPAEEVNYEINNTRNINAALDPNNELSYYVKGYKYREIAIIFNKAEGTVKSNIWRQRQKIFKDNESKN